MPNFTDKPDIEHIKRMQVHLSRVWMEAHGVFKQVDSYYERTFQLWDPKLNRPNIHTLKPRSIVDTALDQLMGHEAQAHRFGEDEGKAEDRDATEKAMNAIFRQAALKESSLSYKAAGKNLILYGYAIVEDDIDGMTLCHAQKEKPERENNEDKDDFNQRVRLWQHRKKTAMPFRIRAPHPTTVLMDPMRKEPQLVIKLGVWTSQDLVDITKEREEQQRGDVKLFEPLENPFALIPTFEYWTEHWHALMTAGVAASTGFLSVGRFAGFGSTSAVPGELLIVEPNTWGFVPFSHAYSGWGQEPSDRSVMNPRFLAVGLIQHAMDDLRMDSQAIAGRHQALMDATFFKTGTTEEAAELEDQMATSDTITLPQGESSVWPMKAPQLPRWLETLDSRIGKDLEEGTFIRALSGVRDTGVTTVGATAINHASGQRKFIPLNTQMEHLGTKSMEHILQWIDILNLDLTVEGHNIKRSMLGGDYSGKVTFQVVDAVLRLQERQQSLTEWQAGAMSLETFWSVSGLEDAAGERDRLADDQVYAHPKVNEMFVEAAAERLGLLKAFREDVKTPGPGAGAVESGQSEIVGLDGRPLQTTLQGGTGQTGELRQPLTPQIASPSRIGQNRAGQAT